jgi:flagellum-specific peptidoglycan hydrolase FlgJ
MAVAAIAISQILQSSSPVSPIAFAPVPDEYLAQAAENSGTYTIPVKEEKVVSKELKRAPKATVKRKSTAVKKAPLKRDAKVTAPLASVKIGEISSIADVQVAHVNVNDAIGKSTTWMHQKKLFSSRADAIVGLWASYATLNAKEKTNVVCNIAQFLFESGLDANGNSSKLGSNANNHYGIKTAVWNHTRKAYSHYSIPFAQEGFVSTGDDEYVGGKKIPSRFAVFSNIEDCMKAHMAFLQKDRYEHYRKFNGISVSKALKACDALYTCGYFTSADAVKGLQNNVRLVAKTLKAAGVVLEP